MSSFLSYSYLKKLLWESFTMQQNYLKAVFWDYPNLCNNEGIRNILEKAREEKDIRTVHWIMSRFLERGRIRDTALFFTPADIKKELAHIKISPRVRKRWERLLEVYGGDS
jgi:hypothetical protein